MPVRSIVSAGREPVNRPELSIGDSPSSSRGVSAGKAKGLPGDPAGCECDHAAGADIDGARAAGGRGWLTERLPSLTVHQPVLANHR